MGLPLLLNFLSDRIKKISGNFNCSYCDSLTSLEGSPEVVRRSFNCSKCNSLTSLKGSPEKIGGNFTCANCKSLKSLKGIPKEIGKNFNCQSCNIKFTRNDVKNVSMVNGNIYV